jgi:hypothetical protein
MRAGRIGVALVIGVVGGLWACEDDAPPGALGSSNIDAGFVEADTGTPSDAGVPDAGRKCKDETFGEPTPIPGLESIGGSAIPRLSEDELTLYFQKNEGAGASIMVARRPSRLDPFGAPTKLEEIDTGTESYASVTADHLAIFFQSTRTGQSLEYVARRADTTAVFGPAVSLGTGGGSPFVTRDGTRMLFGGVSDAGIDLFEATIAGDVLGARTPIQGVSSGATDTTPVLGADGLDLFFSSDRPGDGVKGALDVWHARRSEPTGTFGAPVLVPEVSSAENDVPSWLSPDGCRLYLSRSTLAPSLFVATR